MMCRRYQNALTIHVEAWIEERTLRTHRKQHQIRCASHGSFEDLRRAGRFATRVGRFQESDRRTRGDSPRLFHLPGLSESLAAAGGLLRKALTLPQGFRRAGLV